MLGVLSLGLIIVVGSKIEAAARSSRPRAGSSASRLVLDSGHPPGPDCCALEGRTCGKLSAAACSHVRARAASVAHRQPCRALRRPLLPSLARGPRDGGSRTMDDVIAHRIALASFPPRDVCCGALSLWLGSTVLRRETLGVAGLPGASEPALRANGRCRTRG